MPKFQNLEEYEKWKSEKLKSKDENKADDRGQFTSDIGIQENQTTAGDKLSGLPKLINCPTCESEISINAPSCPKCGEPLLKEILAEAIVVKKRGSFKYFLFSLLVSIPLFMIGYHLSRTGGVTAMIIGSLICGISVFISLSLGFGTYIFVIGACPYCGNKVVAKDKKLGVNCPTCKKRIVIKDNKFLRVQ